MKKICVQCGSEIGGSRVKYCSHECASQQHHDKYTSPNLFRGRSISITGTISELRVAVDLLSKGYDVFRALSPHCSCDLVILKNGVPLRIEVRTVHKKASGEIQKSINKLTGENPTDVYAWVLPDTITYEPPLGQLPDGLGWT